MRSLLILGGAALAFSLAQTMLVPALGELTHQLHTDASGIAWVLTGYLLAAAVATPVAGRLGDMFGKRRLLVISLVVFGAGSTVAAPRSRWSCGSPSRRSASPGASTCAAPPCSGSASCCR